MRSRMTRKSHRGTATSAIWKITYRECVTTFAPTCLPAGPVDLVGPTSQARQFDLTGMV
jgi:hypothetical protein